MVSLESFFLTPLSPQVLSPDLADDDSYGYTDDVMRRMIGVTDYIKNNLTLMIPSSIRPRYCSHNKNDYH